MNIYIENNVSIVKENIVAIIDYNTLLKSQDGRIFLSSLKNKPYAYNIENAKRFIITEENNNIKIYGTDISSNSIRNKFNEKGLKK